MKFILNLYRHHFRWKYIGHRLVNKHMSTDGNPPILYYMTESGRRRIELPPIDKTDMKAFKRYVMFDMVWSKGGPFPSDFVEEKDTLGAMLSRMVDKKIVGEKDDVPF